MNIGIDIRSLDSEVRTGVGEYTYCLLKQLFSVDKNNSYFLFLNSFQESQDFDFDQDNVQVIEDGFPNKLFHLSQSFLRGPKLDKVIERKIDKSLDVFFSPNLSFTTVSSNTKFILTVHDLTFEYFPEFLPLKGKVRHKLVWPKKQCKQADQILTPSQNTKEDLISEYGVEDSKIKVIYPGLTSSFQQNKNIKFSRIKPKYGLPDNYILFLGTLEPRKNIVSLIEAFEASSYSIKDKYKLIIAGAEGWKDKQILKKINNTHNVEYIGYVDEEDKPALFKHAKLFVYPSLYEGFGLPVIESMSVGTPVITSDRSSLSEIAQDSVYLIDPNNINSIKQAISRMIKDEKLYSHYKEKAKRVYKKYSWQQAADKFLEIINKYE